MGITKGESGLRGLRRRIEFKTVFSVGDGWSRQARRGGEGRGGERR